MHLASKHTLNDFLNYMCVQNYMNRDNHQSDTSFVEAVMK
jgi:hypothetical protein